jgi:hypothetical protein
VRRKLPQRFAQLNARHHGHLLIGEHQIVRAALGHFEPLPAIGGAGDVEARPNQVEADHAR